MSAAPTREVAPPEVAPARAPGPSPRRAAASLAGPLLIVVSVLIAMRGFVFWNLLTNQHPDILSFWLPRSCFLGGSLAAGHVPLWNPYEMAGTPFAADPQSGWLYAPAMLLSWLLPCGAGLRAFIVLQPIMAGLGLYWFLRMERLHRAAATAGGLCLALMIAASVVGISLPFSGTLAWTTFALVGTSGFLQASRLSRRLLWMGLAAFAWGQVANAHMSHGLVMCSGLVAAYVAARSVRDVKAGKTQPLRAAMVALGFLAFLPAANLAVLIPRFALITRSSLRGGYAALGGTLARAAGIEDRPLETNGVWSAWPLALGGAPGAYAGAAILLMVPAAVRDRGRRYLLGAFAVTGIIGYLLTLNLLVAAGWFRTLMLHLPFGDVYLHNPGRIRYLALVVVPVLGALGIQGFLERPPPLRDALRWVGAGVALFLVLPLALGAKPERFIVLALGTLAVVPVVLALVRRRRWAVIAVPTVLAAELLAGALWSSMYQGGTVYLGLEGVDHPNLVPGPLRWPDVPVDDYLDPGPIATYLLRQGDARYLTWVLPAADFEKGYLWTQRPPDWPALEMGRGILFGIPDVLGYSPIQLPRYWSYIRATNRLPVFYNASVVREPSIEDVRLLGVRDLIAGRGIQPPLAGHVVASEYGYDLYEIEGWEPRVSVTPRWSRVTGSDALRAVLSTGFDPGMQAVVEGDPGIPSMPEDAAPGTANYREVAPEDVRITVQAYVPSIVVVRNAWDEYWRATVDGRPAPVLRTDYLLQGVPVSAGRHDVTLTYDDPNLGRGVMASVLVWFILVVVMTTALIRERRSR